jgi:hypothetical protein
MSKILFSSILCLMAVQMAVAVEVISLIDETASPEEPDPQVDIFGIDFTKPALNVDEFYNTALVDQIPIIAEPQFTSLKEEIENNVELTNNSYAVIFQYAGETKVYPLKYLNWHNGVQDKVGGENFFIVWDPLTLFTTAWPMDDYSGFGVSGFVHESQSIYFDRTTHGLWHPMTSEAITGIDSGKRIERLATFVAQIGDVLAAEPDAKVMTDETGFTRNYSSSPYYGYMRSKALLFPVHYKTEVKIARKEIVLGLHFRTTQEDIDVAIPINALMETFSKREGMGNTAPLRLSLARGDTAFDEPFTFEIFNGAIKGEFNVRAPKDMEVDQSITYWFAQSSLRKNTILIRYLP